MKLPMHTRQPHVSDPLPLDFGCGPRLERTIGLHTCPIPNGHPWLFSFWLFIYLWGICQGRHTANDWPAHMKLAFRINAPFHGSIVYVNEFDLNVDRRWSDGSNILVGSNSECLYVLWVCSQNRRSDERVRVCNDERHGERDTRLGEQARRNGPVADDYPPNGQRILSKDGATGIVKHKSVPKTFIGEEAFANPCELMTPSE